MSAIITVFAFLGPLGILFIFPGLMNIGLLRISYGMDNVPPAEMVLCFIPFIGNVRAWRAYDSSTLVILNLGIQLICILGIIQRFVFLNTLPSLVTISILWLLISLVCLYLCYVIRIFRVMLESGYYSVVMAFICAILVAPGTLCINKSIPAYIRAMEKAKGDALYDR